MDAAQTASAAYDSLAASLREMLVTEANGLDFGVYRVLRLKRSEITRFIDEGLPTTVREVLAGARSDRVRAQARAVEEFVRARGSEDERALLGDLVANRDAIARFIQYKNPPNASELLQHLEAAITAGGGSADALEARVYNHLLQFIERYYRDGDFGYNDRSLAQYRVAYSGDDELHDRAMPAAEAPYAGRDVLFHWKYKDSYYIKNGAAFASVALRLDELGRPGHRVEWWLEATPADARRVGQNNNRDRRKHFRFERVEVRADEPAPGETTHRVVFRLADRSTPKAEVFARLLHDVFGDREDRGAYLAAAPAKGAKAGPSFFRDPDADFERVEGGTVRGVPGLRLSLDKYLEALAKQPAFASRGGNTQKRIDALRADETVRRLHALDRTLNTFIAGTDSDYFVHKNLGPFLRAEQRRYVQDVIFGDLDVLLQADQDNTALVVGRAFRAVSDRLIEYLAALEDFQKNLFLLRKKVVECRWLVSVGKLMDAAADDPDGQAWLTDRILESRAQLDEWEATFGVRVTDRMHLHTANRTLVIDTRHFPDPAFTDRLLGAFADLDAATDGVLIGSENFQALTFMRERYRARVRCFYIDPPYNSPSSSIIYKNDFRHASWLSLMENRFGASRELLTRDGALVVAIDENEQERLGLLLDETYPEHDRTAVSVVHNPRGIQGDNFSYSSEFAYFVTPTGQKVVRSKRIPRSEWRYDPLKKWGGESERKHGRNTFYPILVKDDKVVGAGPVLPEDQHPSGPIERLEDGTVRVWPVDAKGEGKWRYEWATLKHHLERVRVKTTRKGAIKIEIAKIIAKPKTVWSDKPYDASTWGTRLLGEILGKEYLQGVTGGQKLFPKSLHTVADCLWAVTGNESCVVADYFAGTGTTGHAALDLKRRRKGHRHFVLVEQGEYFEPILVERIRRVMYTAVWRGGRPKPGVPIQGVEALVQVLRLEQYEDVLNALEPADADARDGATPARPLPAGVGVRYLFRPEEQQIRAAVDLSRPFSQAVTYGRERQEGCADLFETYLWAAGLRAQRRKAFATNGRVYRTALAGHRLVVFRDIDAGEDDAAALQEVLAAFDGVQDVYVNHSVEAHRLPAAGPAVHVVDGGAFDAGATWS